MPLQLNEDTQRVGILASLPHILRQFAVDRADVLAKVGLHPQALDHPESTIPYKSMGHLLQVASSTARCPHLGLLLGGQIRTASLGLVGELIRHAPTLGVALEDFAAHQHHNSRGSVVYLQAERQQVSLGYAIYQPDLPGNNVICDTAVMAGLSLIRELVGMEHASVVSVLSCRPKPEDLTRYRESLGDHLRFNAEQTALRLPRKVLEHAVVGADPHLRSDLKERLRLLNISDPLDTVARLRRTLRVALMEGHINADEIASQLGLGRRTLDRRLTEDGVSFQKVLDETRCAFAQQLLAHTRLGVGEIAALIGYGDPSVLTRAFIRWTGQSPSEWRSALEQRHLHTTLEDLGVTHKSLKLDCT